MRALFILIPAIGAMTAVALLSILLGLGPGDAILCGVMAFVFIAGIGISATKPRAERGEGPA